MSAIALIDSTSWAPLPLADLNTQPFAEIASKGRVKTSKPFRFPFVHAKDYRRTLN